MSKLKKIVGEKTLKALIERYFEENKNIGICKICLDEKAEKPYHYIHKNILGVEEVRMIYRKDYKHYYLGLCERHYKKNEQA